MKQKEITIRRYEAEDAPHVLALVEEEGDDWRDYWHGDAREKYQNALSSSEVYLLFTGEECCGFIRCRDDAGYGVYVYDLLVDSKYRGNEYGRLLMERVAQDFPNDIIYVMSDINPYYQELGYAKVGTLFIVKGNS